MIEHFKEYNELDARIRELSYKLEMVNHNIYDAKSVSYGIQARSSIQKTLVDKLAIKDELESQIGELKKVKAKLYDIHVKEIALVEDSRYRSILRSYYLLKMSVDDIGNMLKITPNRIYKLKAEAVKELCNKITQNNTK